MEHIQRTIQYYQENEREYVKKKGGTTDVVPLLEKFRGYLPGKNILEIGFGAGHEALWLKTKGLNYTGVDNVNSFCLRLMNNFPEATVIRQDMRKVMLPNKSFNGIWAMASLLHLNNSELMEMLQKCRKWLKPNGILYASFKEGVGCVTHEDGRFFNYMNQTKMMAFIGSGLALIEEPTIDSPRQYNTGQQNWINFFLRRI